MKSRVELISGWVRDGIRHFSSADVRCLLAEIQELEQERFWTKAQCDSAEVTINNRDAEIKKLKEGVKDDCPYYACAQEIKNRDRTINELRGLVASYKFDWENARDNLRNANNTIAAMRASELDTHRATQKEISEQRERADKAEKGWEEALNRAKDAEVAHARCSADLKEAQKMVSWLSPFAFSCVFGKEANLPTQVEVDHIMQLVEKQYTQPVNCAACFYPVALCRCTVCTLEKQWCKRPGPPGYAACTREKHENGPCAHPGLFGWNARCEISSFAAIREEVGSAQQFAGTVPPQSAFRWWVVQIKGRPDCFQRLLARTETEAKELGRAGLGCRFVDNVVAYPLGMWV